MWLFSMTYYLLVYLVLTFNLSFDIKTIPCWTYDQALGDRFGVHDDPNSPPACPVSEGR